MRILEKMCPKDVGECVVFFVELKYRAVWSSYPGLSEPALPIMNLSVVDAYECLVSRRTSSRLHPAGTTRICLARSFCDFTGSYEILC